MEHLKKYWGWYLLGLIVLFVLFAPKKWWGKYYPLSSNVTATPAEGSACMTTGAAPKAGTIKNGVCVAS